MTVNGRASTSPRWTVSVIIASVLVLSTGVLAAPSTKPEDSGLGAGVSTGSLRIASAAAGGHYAALADVLAELWREQLGLDVQEQASRGSLHNLELLASGEAQLAIVRADVAYEVLGGGGAVGGGHQRASSAYGEVRFLADLYPQVVHFLAWEGVSSFGDIRGRRLAVGWPGSLDEWFVRTVLMPAAALTYADVQPAFHGSPAAMQQLLWQQVDGYVAIVPPAARDVEEIVTTGQVRLVSLGAELVEKLTANTPWLSPFTIPPGTYPGQGEPIETVAIPVLLAARADVSADVALALVIALESVDGRDSVARAREAGALHLLRRWRAPGGLGNMPETWLHDGVRRYDETTARNASLQAVVD